MEGGDKTVVFATHVMEEVRRIADYVLFLADGEFLGLYEKDTLLEEWRIFWWTVSRRETFRGRRRRGR